MQSRAVTFSGQWLVNFDGQQKGFGLLSCDANSPLSGWISLYQEPNDALKTPHLLLKGRTEISVDGFNWTGRAISAVSSGDVLMRGSHEGQDRHAGQWSSSDKLSGEFTLMKLMPSRLPKTKVPEAIGWKDIDDWISARPVGKFIFRGLGSSNFDLISTAHRDGLFDLHRYRHETLPLVARELARLEGKKFNLDNDADVAELMAVIRHHGFPTPVMDWSKSGWISTYFGAVSAIESNRLEHGATFRLYSLKAEAVASAASITEALTAPSLIPQIFEVYSTHTPRIKAQAGVFMVTPCLDVVLPIFLEAQRTQNQRLEAIDIPVSLAPEILRRLDQMNINAMALTPGIDSALKDIRRRLLDL